MKQHKLPTQDIPIYPTEQNLARKPYSPSHISNPYSSLPKAKGDNIPSRSVPIDSWAEKNSTRMEAQRGWMAKCLNSVVDQWNQQRCEQDRDEIRATSVVQAGVKVRQAIDLPPIGRSRPQKNRFLAEVSTLEVEAREIDQQFRQLEAANWKQSQAEQETAAIAEAMYHLMATPPIEGEATKLLSHSSQQASAAVATGLPPIPHQARMGRLTARRAARRNRPFFRSWLQPPRQAIDLIVDGAIWIATAAIVRLGYQWLSTVAPLVAPVVMLLMIAPVALGVCLVISAPRNSAVPAYRLLLTVLGFLLGGRL